MFGKLLIANRGEIACRVMRTAKRMGIRTVAVYSEADALARHTVEADEAIPIGPAPARDSYLRIERIIDAARQTGAEAIHPGYGFLSENPEFADACAAAGIVFVGPPASAMRAMGSKAEAKRLMQAAGVPLVPGYHDADQADALLASEATRIGYPVLIKASAGGGGRGMRAVDRPEDFLAALAAARREAEAAFGDGRVLIEKYLARPRHIEVQLLGDTHGNLVHLGTRDCSIQRRHQKIIEEAPAPGLSDATRENIHQAALAAGRAVNYTNAGTVEFIADGQGPDPEFYFMEMNTRLQVEHRVTEQVCSVAGSEEPLDLVELQLRVAAGEKLPFSQDDLVAQGHAIEARLCAEDPMQEYRPSSGRLTSMSIATWEHDSGYEVGDVVTAHYDSMIAKLYACADSRDAVRRRLSIGLHETRVAGIATNLVLLRRILDHPAFAAGELDTGFIERHRAALLPPPEAAPFEALAAAALDHLLRLTEAADRRPRPPTDSNSPWDACLGFRLHGSCRTQIMLRDPVAGMQRLLATTYPGAWRVDAKGPYGAWTIGHGDRSAELDGAFVGSGGLVMRLDGRRREVNVVHDAGDVVVDLPGDAAAPYRLRPIDPYAPPGADAAGADRITAPIPGTVLRVDVAAGDVVARGKVLVVMEAMKTELRLAAPADGTVARVLVKVGDMVQEGMELVQMTHDEANQTA